MLWKHHYLRDVGVAAGYRISYNSRESPYLHLIFTQHAIGPQRNTKKCPVSFPPNDASNIPPLTQKIKVPKTPQKHKNLVLET